MAWPAEQHFNVLIAQAQQWLVDINIVERDTSSPVRAVLKFEGAWQQYRIVVSEIHRSDNTVRYAYYVLGKRNQHIHRFDNSSDKRAIRLRYGADWVNHQHEEIPHRHNAQGDVVLTSVPMTFALFIEWVIDSLAD